MDDKQLKASQSRNIWIYFCISHIRVVGIYQKFFVYMQVVLMYTKTNVRNHKYAREVGVTQQSEEKTLYKSNIFRPKSVPQMWDTVCIRLKQCGIYDVLRIQSNARVSIKRVICV